MTTESTKRFKRISSGNNKYKINQVQDNDIVNNTDNGITYLDSMTEHLYHKNVSEDVILKLIKYLKSEQFETETVDIDLFLSDKGGNINKYMIKNQKCVGIMIDMFRKSRSYVSCVFTSLTSVNHH